MKAVKASELGSFAFCKRAWYYQNKGVSSLNQTALRRGSYQHSRQAWQVAISQILLVLGLLGLGAAVLLGLLR